MVLTDMVMPHMSGLEFLEKVKKLLPRIEVAVMTGHGSIENRRPGHEINPSVGCIATQRQRPRPNAVGLQP